MSILIGTTVPPYAGPAILSWLETAEEISLTPGVEVEWFAAIETDRRPHYFHAGLISRLAQLGGEYWSFSLDDREDEIDSLTRLQRICTGRNLVTERALRDPTVTHVLFLDADLRVPGDALQRLLEIDHPVVGGHVPSYCLDGPRVPECEGMDVRAHWNTAGFLLVRRDVLRKVRWGHSSYDDEITDDPWYQARVREIFGTETWVRHDLIGVHESLVPLETRRYDRSYIR